MQIADPSTVSFRLDGKRALVTGGGRGLGRGCAQALAAAGAHVAVVARSSGEIGEVAAVIRTAGGSAEAAAIDVKDIAAFDAYIRESEPFDIFVNNAGTNRPGPFVEVTADDFDAVMTLNLRSAFFAAQAVVRRLLQAGRRGSIINVSSQMGHVGAARRTIYCASKHAIEGLTKAMAVELGPQGIRVNTLSPTFIETPMTKPFFEDPVFREDVLKKIKLGRIGKVEDILGAVIFLASDASSLMTGASLVIDGGWTAD